MTTFSPTNPLQSPRTVLGLLLVSLGGFFLVRQLVSYELHLSSLLPWAALGIGAYRLFRLDLVRGYILATLGVYFLLPRVVPTFDPLQYWPLLLVDFGLFFVIVDAFDLEPKRSPSPTSHGNSWAIFGGRQILETSRDFRGGQHLAFIGSIKLDLTGAELAPEGAHLEVYAVWAGIEIRVPPHWSVELRTVPFMGGAEDKTRAPEPIEGYAPRLVITGFVSMAGVEVTP